MAAAFQLHILSSQVVSTDSASLREAKTLGNQKSHVVPVFCELSHVHLPLIVSFR